MSGLYQALDDAVVKFKLIILTFAAGRQVWALSEVLDDAIVKVKFDPC